MLKNKKNETNELGNGKSVYSQTYNKRAEPRASVQLPLPSLGAEVAGQPNSPQSKESKEPAGRGKTWAMAGLVKMQWVAEMKSPDRLIGTCWQVGWVCTAGRERVLRNFPCSADLGKGSSCHCRRDLKPQWDSPPLHLWAAGLQHCHPCSSKRGEQ